MTKKYIKLLIILIPIALLAGCGQTGSLYLPKEDKTVAKLADVKNQTTLTISTQVTTDKTNNIND